MTPITANLMNNKKEHDMETWVWLGFTFGKQRTKAWQGKWKSYVNYWTAYRSCYKDPSFYVVLCFLGLGMEGFRSTI